MNAAKRAPLDMRMDMQLGMGKTAKWTMAAVLACAGMAQAQTAPRVSGTVKAAGGQSITVTVAGGQDVTVAVPESAKLVQVAPGSKDLKSATPIAVGEILVGDKVLITGTAGDAADAVHAARVVVMKSAEIASSHAAEEAAWQHGGGGLVKSADAAAGTITVSSGVKTLTVKTSPATKLRRYAGGSVKFEDATVGTFADVQPGDQLRVRGTKSEDGSSIVADEIVTGAFRNFSGLLTAVDGTAGTVTLKDLASKKTVTVKVTTGSDIRRLPVEAAQRFAARSAGAASPAGAGARPAGAPGAPSGPMGAGPGGPGGSAGAAGGPGGSARAGMDLSQMLSRLPTETLGDLKIGDAVMIVATLASSDSTQPTAVTVLGGVEPILQASPKGEMTLSPWSVGSGAPEGGGQ